MIETLKPHMILYAFLGFILWFVTGIGITILLEVMGVNSDVAFIVPMISIFSTMPSVVVNLSSFLIIHTDNYEKRPVDSDKQKHALRNYYLTCILSFIMVIMTCPGLATSAEHGDVGITMRAKIYFTILSIGLLGVCFSVLTTKWMKHTMLVPVDEQADQ